MQINNVCLVLLYHRVNNLIDDGQYLAVSPKNFDLHINYITKTYNVISASSLGETLKERQSLKPSIVVTFDDGYADNFEYAIPILKKYNCPATFFVSSGYMNTSNIFWWDKIELLIKKSTFKVGHFSFTHLGLDLDLSPQNQDSTYNSLMSFLKTQPIETINSIIAELDSLTLTQPEVKDKYKMLTHQQVFSIAADPLFTIGSHTVNHPILANESEDNCIKELINSRSQLSNLTGKDISIFSYPLGSTADVNLSVVKQVEKYYSSAYANVQSVSSNYTSPYWIPRKIVRNWAEEDFIKFVDECFMETGYAG